ncbi:unnamed protein product [Notodromas monacha]|uniref:Rhodanese domain-containing protein n=1 Tax=Notodromas monacha TaxID=399045 RepID=A0A7R9BWG5_9CRUS|nr:unnamed protein product [Notodromas monacha]CAG0921659.1 unnamed protein product [Notodromas monacha]
MISRNASALHCDHVSRNLLLESSLEKGVESRLRLVRAEEVSEPVSGFAGAGDPERQQAPFARKRSRTAGSIWARRMMTLDGAVRPLHAPMLRAPPVRGVGSKRTNALLATPVVAHDEDANEVLHIQELDAGEMADVLHASSLKVLILDCRSFLDFNNGHVYNAVNVWCSKLLNRRLQQNKVTAQEVLRNTFHLEVGEAELVVIYDEDSAAVSALETNGFTDAIF